MAKTFKNISWEAEEFLVRERNIWWYLGLFAVGGGLCVLAVFFEAWTFLILIILSVITIFISSFRLPRKIKYVLNQDGLKEGDRLHNYDEFKAFGILKDGSHFSAVLIPKKRFGLLVKVYFPEGSGEEIVDTLGARLPMEEVKLDLLDKVVNFLRI